MYKYLFNKFKSQNWLVSVLFQISSMLRIEDVNRSSKFPLVHRASNPLTSHASEISRDHSSRSMAITQGRQRISNNFRFCFGKCFVVDWLQAGKELVGSVVIQGFSVDMRPNVVDAIGSVFYHTVTKRRFFGVWIKQVLWGEIPAGQGFWRLSCCIRQTRGNFFATSLFSPSGASVRFLVLEKKIKNKCWMPIQVLLP